MKLQKKIAIVLVCTIVATLIKPTLVNAETKSVNIYHTHTASCNSTTYVMQDSDNAGGASGLRTVGSRICMDCGGKIDDYRFDSICSCGAEWHTTGHACEHSTSGEHISEPPCGNVSVIDCNTHHNHPTAGYGCGMDTITVIGTLSISGDTATSLGVVTLSATVNNSLSRMNNAVIHWSNGSTENSIDVTTNDTYSCYVTYVEDGTSVTSASVSITLTNIDSTPPAVTLLPNTITDTAGDVVLTVSASDAGVGLAAQPYSWDGGSTWGTEVTKTVSSNGTYTVHVRDSLSNIGQQSYTVSNIDKDGPLITLVPNITTVTAGDITLTALATDTGVGIATDAYSWDGGNTWGTDTNKTVSSNGTYAVHVRDSLGNIEQKSYDVSNIDREAPIITLTPDIAELTSGDVKLTVSATDTGAGLATDAYSWDGGQTWVAEGFEVVGQNGDYTVFVRDALGNTGSQSYKVSNIDKGDYIPPVIYSLTASEIDENGIITLTVLVDTGDAVVSWDGGHTWGDCYQLNISAKGTYTVCAKDKAGNITRQSIDVLFPEEPKEIEPPQQVQEEEPSEVPSEVPSEEPVSEEPEPKEEVVSEEEPEETSEEVSVVEKTNELAQGSRLEYIISVLPKAAIATTATAGGGGFIFFGFWWFLGDRVKIASLRGMQFKKIGTVKIKKKNHIYTIHLSQNLLRKASSNMLQLEFKNSFIKKHENEAIIIGGTTYKIQQGLSIEV